MTDYRGAVASRGINSTWLTIYMQLACQHTIQCVQRSMHVAVYEFAAAAYNYNFAVALLTQLLSYFKLKKHFTSSFSRQYRLQFSQRYSFIFTPCTPAPFRYHYHSSAAPPPVLGIILLKQGKEDLLFLFTHFNSRYFVDSCR